MQRQRGGGQTDRQSDRQTPLQELTLLPPMGSRAELRLSGLARALLPTEPSYWRVSNQGSF